MDQNTKQKIEMSEAAREAKRKYQKECHKEWREKNTDKLEEYRARYWEKKASEGE